MGIPSLVQGHIPISRISHTAHLSYLSSEDPVLRTRAAGNLEWNKRRVPSSLIVLLGNFRAVPTA